MRSRRDTPTPLNAAKDREFTPPKLTGNVKNVNCFWPDQEDTSIHQSAVKDQSRFLWFIPITWNLVHTLLRVENWSFVRRNGPKHLLTVSLPCVSDLWPICAEIQRDFHHFLASVVYFGLVTQCFFFHPVLQELRPSPSLTPPLPTFKCEGRNVPLREWGVSGVMTCV